MFNLLRKHHDNPWLAQERRGVRNVIVTAMVIATLVLAGIGGVIYALANP